MQQKGTIQTNWEHETPAAGCTFLAVLAMLLWMLSVAGGAAQ